MEENAVDSYQTGPNTIGPFLAELESLTDVRRHCGIVGGSLSKAIRDEVSREVPRFDKTPVNVGIIQMRGAPL